MQSPLHPHLLRAYRETEYHVTGSPPLILRVGQHSPELGTLMKIHKARSCAFITASNPRSQRLDATLNALKQAALATELRASQLPFREGIGMHPSNNWPGEPSFLVLGISESHARMLAIRYEQNAILWADHRAVPEIRMTLP